MEIVKKASCKKISKENVIAIGGKIQSALFNVQLNWRGEREGLEKMYMWYGFRGGAEGVVKEEGLDIEQKLKPELKIERKRFGWGKLHWNKKEKLKNKKEIQSEV